MQLGLVVAFEFSMGNREFVIILFAILAIAVLEVAAIINHIDGVTFSAAIIAIAGLGGYEMRGWREKRGSK